MTLVYLEDSGTKPLKISKVDVYTERAVPNRTAKLCIGTKQGTSADDVAFVSTSSDENNNGLASEYGEQAKILRPRIREGIDSYTD